MLTGSEICSRFIRENACFSYFFFLVSWLVSVQFGLVSLLSLISEPCCNSKTKPLINTASPALNVRQTASDQLVSIEEHLAAKETDV